MSFATDITETAEQEEIRKFKERFSIGRAQELETARTKLTRSEIASSDADKALATAQEEFDDAKRDFDAKKLELDTWDEKWRGKSMNVAVQKGYDRIKKNKEKAESTLATKTGVRDTRLAERDQARRDAADDDKALKELLKKAERELQKQKRQAAKAQIHALARYVREAGLPEGADELIKKLWDDFNAVFAPLVPDEPAGASDDRLAVFVAEAVPKLEKEVYDACSGTRLEPALAELTRRLAALDERGVSNKKTVDAIRKAVTQKAPTLYDIEKTHVPAVTAIETQAEEFEGRQAEIAARIVRCKEPGLPDDAIGLAGWEEEFGKAVRRAKLDVGAALTMLDAVEAGVEKVAGKVAAELQAKIDCGPLKDSVAALTGKFELLDKSLRGYLPGNRAQKLFTAETHIGKKYYLLAQYTLEDLEAALKAGLKRAEAKAKQLSAEEIERQAIEEERQAKAAQKAKAEREQKEREDAPTAQSLDAIGRDRKFATWYKKVETLYGAKLITLTAGNAIPLSGGGTIEVVVSVAAESFQDRFVIHYHKDASGPTIDNPYASRMHAKPYRGNKMTPRVYLSNGDWIFRVAPKIRDV